MGNNVIAVFILAYRVVMSPLRLYTEFSVMNTMMFADDLDYFPHRIDYKIASTFFSYTVQNGNYILQ